MNECFAGASLGEKKYFLVQFHLRVFLVEFLQFGKIAQHKNFQDYKLENNRIKLINTDQLFYEWMFRNINYMEFPDTVDDEFIANYKDWDKNAKYSNTFGFFFDSSKIFIIPSMKKTKKTN